ncbi:SNF2 domain-containing protein CLASSY 4-like [Actinidia eriantha]|uniref:SNF2 domain-containing protein CLASSY 4-like n=1 Tax=Actinidia eriantha TaxID=165200 RepID=UPI00258F560F|nr:SNF2 domain-containing protein CLASSY 4-like [Actinidia eriantha]XP_057514048.1 SNF2 domain-containing protein CLASSY 4-like [Actinidia eriantha]XP_057514049.1 SNF2 domain-containing protein CLASSY 4-like [Actinidia eriantha]XP_057514050.1 SNF2 domain-containing protein CLASSY 4-like [Actinidia eriantha]
MDYSKVPLAKRTRFQEEVFFREYNEGKKKKKQKREKESTDRAKEGVDSVSFEKGETSGPKKVRKPEKGLKKIGKNEEGLKKHEKFVVSSVDLKKHKNAGRMGVEASIDSKKKRKWGKKSRGKKNVGGEIGGDCEESEIEYLGMSVGRESEDDEIEFLGMNSGVVDSNCSSFEEQSGFYRTKNWGHVDGEEGSSCNRKRDKCSGVKISEGKSCGGLNRAQSRLGVLGKGKGKKVNDFVSTDLDDSESEDSGDSKEPELSGEEDNDLSSDQDCEQGNSLSSTSSDDSSSSSDYDDDGGDDESSIVNIVSLNGNGKEEILEGGLKRGRGRPSKDSNFGQLGSEGSGIKRRKIYGLDILVDCEREEDGTKSVAERIRSRRAYKPTKSRKKKRELGTLSSPFTITDGELNSSSGDEEDTDDDEETRFENRNDAKNTRKAGEKGERGKRKVERPAKRRIDSSSGDEDDTDGDEETCFEKCNDAKNVHKASEKGTRKVGRPAKRRRDSVDLAAPISIDKILADSIWEKGDIPLEKLVSTGNEVPDQDPTLPLKFRLEDEDPKPPEKSYWDLEADKLFAEMDFAIAACEIGSSDSSMVDEDSITQEMESDPVTCCRQGKHQLVLDEQIGLKCKFCSFVKLEIKHILPSFSKHPLGRPDWRALGSTDLFNLDELRFQDSSFGNQSGSKQHTLSTGTVWDIIPGIKNSMYPHQREGFEFIWQNIAGGIELEELKKRAFEGGSGCIISHAPGTGKTRLTIMFLQTFMELNPNCMPVIIAPKSMLLTWEEEFKKWKVDIPFHNLNKPELSGRENSVAVNLLRKFGRRGANKSSIRMVKLYSWKMDKSILGISYSLFEKLAKDELFADDGRKMNARVKNYDQGEQVRKMLLELPGLLVLDEGHNPRNDQSLIWQALSRVKTQKRIILSGTPFQNNFGELFNTLCLVRPKFADKISSEIRGKSGRKWGRKSRVARGKWASLTDSIGKDTNDKLYKLRTMIDPFVHVHKGAILKESLPGLRDSMVILHPTDLQKDLIEVIQARKNQLELDCALSLVSVHPSLLLGSCLAKELSFDRKKLEMLRSDAKAGVKTKFLMELIRLSMALKEKVLVFSQFIDSLSLVREQLISNFHWTEGRELLYMDGSLDPKHRQASISLLNDPESEVQVLLASTRACCEGINLVGASRVVLLDVAWNPSVERQAISRAYRLGQKKIVYIYHLITSGTKEEEKYIRQAEKGRLSELVFSYADSGVIKLENSCAVTEDKILQEIVQHERISHMFERILIRPKESNFN